MLYFRQVTSKAKESNQNQEYDAVKLHYKQPIAQPTTENKKGSYD